MALMIKIKPVKIKARTQREIINRLEGDFRTGFSNSFGFGLIGHQGGRYEGLVRFYSLEKHNRKVKVTKRVPTRGKDKGKTVETREVAKEAHWVAHYYDIPREMVDMSGTRQGNRTFKIKFK